MQTKNERSAKFPPGFQFLFKPHRYKVAYGGRGSGKSWAFSRALVLQACQRPLRVLCTRELQTSIAESVHRLLSDQIELLGLSAYFEIQQAGIYRKPYPADPESGFAGDSGSEFIFYGVKTNPTKIKSAEGIDVAWVEEAEKVSANSWQILIPTIRKDRSEIWVSFNPDEENDPTYQRFVVSPPPDAFVAEVNWHQNPWFPDELRREKDYLYRVDPDAAAHVWGGQCRKNSSSQIFRDKYAVESFDVPNPAERGPDNPMWDGPYYGADWGFAQDPTVLVRFWVDSKARILYVEKESYHVGLELDAIGAQWRKDIPEVASDGRVVRADNARPETISYLSRTSGLAVEAAEKWSGSIEDGIAFLRKFEKIVIHPRCRNAAQEARLYSYKTDRLTGDVLAEAVDKHNHFWDSLRYGCQPMITGSGNVATWIKAFA
jgi:phage terminase large subunit